MSRKSTHHELSHDGTSEIELLFKAVTGQSLIGNYIIQDGIIRYINSVAASYTGYNPKELIDKNTDFIVHSEDIKLVKRNALTMLKNNSHSPQEFRILTKHGDVRWIKEKVSQISYKGKRAIMGNVIDITDQKKAEEALQESRRRFGDLIEFLPDATFAIDLEGKLIAWNRVAEDLTEIKAKDILGKSDYAIGL